MALPAAEMPATAPFTVARFGREAAMSKILGQCLRQKVVLMKKKRLSHFVVQGKVKSNWEKTKNKKSGEDHT